MEKTSQTITSHILKKYDSFIKQVTSKLAKDGHLTKQQMKQLMADGRVILSLEDRYIILSATRSTKDKEREVKFEFIVKMK